MDATSPNKARRFNRYCAVGALLFLTLSTVHWLTTGMRARDFSQYYMAGLIARDGTWDSLYPIVDPANPRNPGYVDDSVMKPRYAQLAESSGVGNQYRFIQPPPLALLMLPFAWMSFHTAWVVWTLLMMLCMFGICVQAGRIFNICNGGESRAAGIITLLLAVSPETLHWIDVRNLSTAVGWLVGVAAIDLLDRRSLRGAVAICLAGVTKYVGAILAPLYLASRKWAALGMMAGVSIVVLSVSIAVTGWPVFHEFIHTIAPTLDRCSTSSWNQSLEGIILQVMHEHEKPNAHLELALHIGRLIVLAVILLLIFRRPKDDWKNPLMVFAAVSALMIWMLIFSPIYWDHYDAYIAPCFGWLAWEATQGPVRRAAAAIALLLFEIPTAYLENFHLPDVLLAHGFWACCLMFGVAIWRLCRSSNRPIAQ